jgi:SAM-dependent methyltransferase
MVKRRYRLRPSPLDPWRRVAPVSVDGSWRGKPVDRYYIEKFLSEHRSDIHGRALEVADNEYTMKYGTDVTSDILHVSGSATATIVGDLESGTGIPVDAFDCVILTQTLHFIYDYRAALRHLFTSLRPGGVLLCTVPGIAQVSRYDADRWGDYYRFTGQAAVRMLADAGFGQTSVQTYGNVLTASGMLSYLAIEDFTKAELELDDPDYPVIVGMYGMRT